MKIATTKERILQYLEIKGIKKAFFFKETGIRRGFLDKDKLKQAVSDEHFTKIIAKYSDISIEWLITGGGEMLKSKHDELPNKITQQNNIYGNYKDKYIHMLEENRELRLKIEKLENELKQELNKKKNHKEIKRKESTQN